MRILTLAAAATVAGLVAGLDLPTAGSAPLSIEPPAPLDRQVDAGPPEEPGPDRPRVLPAHSKPFAPLSIGSVRVDSSSVGWLLSVEVQSRMPAQGVEVSLVDSSGAAVVGPDRIELGSIGAAPTPCEFTVARSTSIAAAIQVQVRGWISPDGHPMASERVGATRWVLIGDPPAPETGRTVTTVGDPLARLARSTDSRARRIAPANREQE